MLKLRATAIGFVVLLPLIGFILPPGVSSGWSTSYTVAALLVLGAIGFMVLRSKKTADFVPVNEIKCAGVAEGEVKRTIDNYEGYFDSKDANPDKRRSTYTTMINNYYDLVTDFYEYGWGQSFHFASRHRNESFEASLARHEFFLGLKLGLKPGMKALDVGCGVGGPMRAIARFTGASITGVNNNEYQIKRGQKQNASANLSELCDFIKCDFMKIPVPDASYDSVYAIEATCHAPDKVGIYSELFRTLKPGGSFAGYEWTVTDNYDPNNKRHKEVKEGIERGDSLPELATPKEVIDALKESGFEVVEWADLVEEGSKVYPIPWYDPLAAGMSLTGFKHTSFGRAVTTVLVSVLERLRLAPKGTTQTQKMLCAAADNLVAGGRMHIFTPMLYFLARKPLVAASS